jgi:hypothetical protein
LFIPSPEILEKDSNITICNWEILEDKKVKFRPEYDSITYSIYDFEINEFLEINDSGLYYLDPGNYLISYYDSNANQIIKTNLNIELSSVYLITSIDTLWYNCDFPDSIDFVRSCVNGVMYDRYDQSVNESSSGHYTLNPQEPYYTFICTDSANCKKYSTQLIFKDIIEVPASTSNFLNGMYNRNQNPCCFIDLTDAECDGETPLTFGQEIQVYNMDAELLYETNLELYGGTVLGFRFCPPQWDTGSNVISNWYSIVIRNDECSFCRMDFKCDSVGDPQPFAILSHPSGKLKENLGGLLENLKLNDGINNKTSQSKIKLPTSVSIFPNPANSEITVKVINSNYTGLNIRINDATGKLVYNNRYETTNGNLSTKVNLEEFDSGVYSVYIPELNYYYKIVLIK